MSDPSSIFPKAPEWLALALELVDYMALNNRLDIIRLEGSGLRAVVVVLSEKGIDQDQLLWDTFVKHRNGLAKVGWRLTEPVFDDCGFTAQLKRIRPETP